jgi:hypothetical protein
VVFEVCGQVELLDEGQPILVRDTVSGAVLHLDRAWMFGRRQLAPP